MDFSPKDFVSPENILTEVLLNTDEQGYKYVTKGDMLSAMQKCMEAISYDTFFHELQHYDTVPDNLRLEIPRGAFNIRRVYLYNGTECSIGTNTKNVYWKREYRIPEDNTANSVGYLANNKGLNKGRDPFFTPDAFDGYRDADDGFDDNLPINYDPRDNSGYTDLYWYNVENGVMMFSPNCRGQKVAIVFNAVFTQIGETPCIPNYLREVVTDWVCEYVTRIKGIRKKQERQIWMMENNRYKSDLGYKPWNPRGSFAQAERRIKRMNSKDREDLKEYLAKIDY